MTTTRTLTPEELPALCRRRHLYALGLSKDEVAKLVRAGVLIEHRARRSQRAYFHKNEVMEAIYGQRDRDK